MHLYCFLANKTQLELQRYFRCIAFSNSFPLTCALCVRVFFSNSSDCDCIGYLFGVFVFVDIFVGNFFCSIVETVSWECTLADSKYCLFTFSLSKSRSSFGLQ